MTTITIDTDTPTVPMLTTDGYTIVGRDAVGVAHLIRKANASPIARPFVQKAKGGEGTGSLGLYVEAVVHTAAGKPFTHLKFFVVGAHVYAYNRVNGDARANWKHRTAPSLQAALNLVQSAINKDNVAIFGHPVLVELTADDLSAIEEGGMPPARFRGQYRIEKDFGRYDFEMDIVHAPLPAGLVATLRNGFVTVTTEDAS